MEPTLYGITKSNRKSSDFWGKNQFNSTFPASLACYMKDKKINAAYLKLNKDLKVVAEEIPIEEVFNTTAANEEISFQFESRFDPYQKYAFDDIKGIDLVIREGENWCRPLEVKLTVIPDETTYDEDESLWGSELVIRPVTTSYCALGMWDSCHKSATKIREIFEPVCHKIQHWDSKIEISGLQDDLLSSINSFQKKFYQKQKPFLLQPVWKTKGKSPVLDDNAFDIFVWSDFALCRPFIERSKGAKNEVNRYLRSSARLCKIFYELSTSGKTHIAKTYAQMTFDHQTDKEFALSGKITRDYIATPRRMKPILSPGILKEIILNGGEKKLSPERRFDQTIYFYSKLLFGESE